MAGEIARSLHDLIGVNSSTVSVLVGQGAGGGAHTLLPADRTIAAQPTWRLSPIPPEGAGAVVHGTPTSHRLCPKRRASTSSPPRHGTR